MMAIRIHICFPIVVILITEDEIFTKENVILFAVISAFESMCLIYPSSAKGPRERKKSIFLEGLLEYICDFFDRVNERKKTESRITYRNKGHIQSEERR